MGHHRDLRGWLYLPAALAAAVTALAGLAGLHVMP